MKPAEVLSSLSNFFYPPLCLHCEDRVENPRLICDQCAPFFELIDPNTRCSYCFTESPKACQECVKNKRWNVKMLSALEYIGPVATLVRKLKGGRAPYLAKTAAALMAAQFLQSNWPIPDIIVPIPGRSFLAQALGKILQCSVQSSIGKRIGSLELEFYLRKAVVDKTVLIVDDVIFTGATVRHAAKTLLTGYPKRIYALTLARSDIDR